MMRFEVWIFVAVMFRTFELYSSSTEASIKQLYGKLRSHSNRIGFAAGRLNLVQGMSKYLRNRL